MERRALRDAASSWTTLDDEGLLLQEITHRVKNEFASAIATVSLAAARSKNDEVKITLGRVLDCLENYALVHRALQIPADDVPIDALAYLRQLCRSISRSKLSSQGIELVLIEHPLDLRSGQCWRLGMIVSELVTNAARHAFGGAGGTIKIELLAADGYARCRVVDNGTASGTVRPARGLRIVAALAKALNGKVEQQVGAHGTVSLVSFPLY
jgi:two-component sensor histidine kinase